MRIKVQEIGSGLHPRESVVKVDARGGAQELVLEKGSIQGGTIEVGNPIAQHGQFFLVELPAETSSGAWRVWVHEDKLQRVMEAAE
jgi:hypothetical protein